jgi:hypothetical protein
MVYKLALGEKYVPKSMDNDKSDKPITFNLRFLSVADRAELGTFYVPVKATKSNVQIRLDMREAFIRCVKSIENLTIEDDGKERDIVSGADFVDLPGFDEMYLEICMRIKESAMAEKKS